MAVVRVIVLSDTHGQHRSVSVPDGDLLIHCGDWTKSSSKPEVEAYQDFASWLANLPHPQKVVVSGNKEIYMDTESCVKHRGKSLEEIEAVQQLLYCEGVTYLCDSGFLYEKSDVHLKLWGAPWTKRNGKAGKAFQVEVVQMKENWEKVTVTCSCSFNVFVLMQIPSDTDILVTHSPALGRLDKTEKGEAAGCPHLRDTIQRIRYHIFFLGWGVNPFPNFLDLCSTNSTPNMVWVRGAKI